MKKKKNKYFSNTSTGDTNEIYRMIKIFIGVVIIFLVFYFAYAFFSGEFKKDESEEEKTTEFQNVEILAGATFKQSQEEYMVFFVDYEEVDSVLIDLLRSNYNSSAKTKLRTYMVDTSKKINQNYVVSDEKDANKKPTGVNNLKVYGTTLIRIKKGKVVKYISGVSEIRKYVESLLN